MIGRDTWPCMTTSSYQIMFITWHLWLIRFFRMQYIMGNKRTIPLKGTLKHRRSSITSYKNWKSMVTNLLMSARIFGT